MGIAGIGTTNEVTDEMANEMGSLRKTIDRLHTTPMGEMRIRNNLGLQAADVVLWCKDAVSQADVIISQGKNWYA